MSYFSLISSSCICNEDICLLRYGDSSWNIYVADVRDDEYFMTLTSVLVEFAPSESAFLDTSLFQNALLFNFIVWYKDRQFSIAVLPKMPIVDYLLLKSRHPI